MWFSYTKTLETFVININSQAQNGEKQDLASKKTNMIQKGIDELNPFS